jgi:DNA-directed RNA polymerase specialized sigma24 family protein
MGSTQPAVREIFMPAHRIITNKGVIPVAPHEVNDDELVLLLGPREGDAQNGAGEEARAKAIEEIQRRYWAKVWTLAEKTLTKYLKRDSRNAPDLDGACRIDLNEFTTGVFLWLVNEGAQKYRQYRAKPANSGRTFEGWLATVTRNRLVDLLRRQPPASRMPSAGGQDRETDHYDPPSPGPKPDQVITVPIETIEDLEDRVAKLTRASGFRAALQDCLLSLRDARRNHFLATFLAYGGLLDGDEIAKAMAGLLGEESIPKATVATWQSRGLHALQACLGGKGFHFQPRRTGVWTESFRGAVVMSFTDEVLVRSDQSEVVA